MTDEVSSTALPTKEDWQRLLRRFKEQLAQRLWALPTVSEAEKELVYKEYLSDLDEFERSVSDAHDEMVSLEKRAHEENDLLRSLLGIPEEELRARSVALNHDLNTTREDMERVRSELDEATRRGAESDEENKQLRKRIYDLESKADHFRVEQLKMREDNVKYFSEANEALKNQLKDLESRMDNLRHLFAETNEQYLIDKQREISTLQKSLLEEMDKALHQKQELLWAEEQMFAEGVAHRVRTTLVSLQGQLLFTLERLGLLDPESKTEAFWKTRWHLLFQGASELSENFQAIQTQLQDVTRTLDDFMHLTKRREISREPVDMKALVQKEMAEVYVDRQPTLSLEFFTDDPLPYVKGDRELLAFLVRTLLRNALETLPNGAGKIEITLKNQSAQGQVQIFVRDSGEGIPSYLLPRLFQPFFTTKDGRQGLNLSRAKKYAEFHGGTLELVKTDKEGTTFRVDLSIEGGA